MRSIHDIINNGPETKPNHIRAEDYKWVQLWGETDIRKWIGDETSTKNSLILEADSRFNPLGHYCSNFKESFEVVELTDKRILACVATYEFAGTFASHDDIQVAYYGLTPKTKAELLETNEKF